MVHSKNGNPERKKRFRVPKMVPGTKNWYPEPEIGTRNAEKCSGYQEFNLLIGKLKMGNKVSRSGKSSTRIRPRGIRRQESRTCSRSCGFEGPRPRGPVQPPPPPPPKLNIYHRGSSPFRRAPKGGELKSAVRALRMIVGAHLVRRCKERFPRSPSSV